MKTRGTFENGLTRRESLRLGLAGATGWFLPRSGAAAEPVIQARARAVIQVWLWGGPCHLDTFDPKPAAGAAYTGRLDKAIETNVDGLRINAALPQLAKLADTYALLRGMTHGINGHETASYTVMSGWKEGDGLVHPSIGAVVSWFKGYRAGYTGLIPPYVTLVKPQGRFSEAGFLGSRFQPFATGGDPAKTPFTVEGVVMEGISEKRQQNRRRLRDRLDTLSRMPPSDPVVASLRQAREDAYSLILGEAKATFELDKEPEPLRERYGKSTFGQSCLAARKLVEAGVPFVTINVPLWDTHKKHFEMMGRMLPELDRGLSTLISDLNDRGLLDSTIVWCGGEFGRTPKVDWDPPWNGGRGHYGKAFSHLVAGGGFKGGRVVGATSAQGQEVIERPVYPWDLACTLYSLLGIDYKAMLPAPDGSSVPVSPLADETCTLPRGGLLHEII
jgi:hypothetical protein